MAENKKSFLLYADLLHTFEELTDEEAGKLIKHLLRYVNDLDPEAPDRLTKIAFEPIRRQLKRDLQKWDLTKEENSKNGQMGNLKRWNEDLYRRCLAKEITLEEAVKIANDRRISPPDSPPINFVAPLSPSVAKIADTVNDTVNDTVKEEDINIPAKAETIDFDKFIKAFNGFGGRSFRVTEKVKLSLRARLKEYKKDEVMKAIENAHKDEYHQETAFKYLTPEFILRPDKLEKFLNQPVAIKKSGFQF
jgi:uncharacterized phage protein (TIGR02220 family)